MNLRYVKRLAARGRSALPSLWGVSILVLGQLVGETASLICHDPGAVSLAGVMSLAASIIIKVKARWSVALLSVGILSSALTLAAPQALLEREPFSALIQIKSTPKRGRFHEIRFHALISPRAFQDSSLKAPIQAWCSAIELPWLNIEGAARGDWYQVLAELAPLSLDLNPFSWERALAREGAAATCRVIASSVRLDERKPPSFELLRERVITRVQTLTGKSEATGLLLSLSIGGDYFLGARTKEAFRMTGLAHVLVVSGYQVSLLIAWLSIILYRFGGIGTSLASVHLLRVISRVTAICGGFVYVGLTGFEDAGLRAFVASGYVFASALFQQSPRYLETYVGSLLLVLVIWPGSLFEASTQLTYAALLGIYIGENGTMQGARHVFIRLMRITVWATLYAMVVSCLWFREVSLLAFPCNILIAPLFSFGGTLCGLLGFTLTYLSETIGQAALTVVRDFVWWLRDVVCEISAHGDMFIFESNLIAPFLLLVGLFRLGVQVQIWIRSQGSLA